MTNGLRTIAEPYVHARRCNLVDVDEVSAWTDAVILAAEWPHIALIEACAAGADAAAVAFLVRSTAPR